MERVRGLAQHPEIVAETLRPAQEQSAVGATEVRAELQASERELRRLNGWIAVAGLQLSFSGRFWMYPEA